MTERDIIDWFTSHSSAAIRRVIERGEEIIETRRRRGGLFMSQGIDFVYYTK